MIVTTKFSSGSIKKQYLSELIGQDYYEWRGKKILLTAPTGMGKTNFILNVFLPYCKISRCKMLILCNRKMLRMQYWEKIVEENRNFDDVKRSVSVMTYQELAEVLRLQQNIAEVLSEFGAIVCDECHYFYSDSDFNGAGTYVLLQELIIACMAKTMIFMSATMEETGPLIEQTIDHTFWRLRVVECKEWLKDNWGVIEKIDYTGYANYDRFRCICVPDWESMAEIVAESSKKSLIFLNHKEKGEKLAERIIKTGKISKNDITILNSDNIDKEIDYVEILAIGHRMKNKILITTSVLDNGVSIHDPDVGIVVIETESKIEFLQMLGRIRSESTDHCDLYFVKRGKKDFLPRLKRYEEEVEKFNEFTNENLMNNCEYYIQAMWNDDAKTNFFRKSLVRMKSEHQVFEEEKYTLSSHRSNFSFAVNRFAERKIGKLFMTENLFYDFAISDPLKVIYEQMKWIKKEPEELEIIDSRYREKRENEFLKRLLSINDVSKEDLSRIKTELVQNFHKEFFDDISAKTGTISNDKLQDICARYGLELCTREDKESRNIRYRVVRCSDKKTEKEPQNE